MRSIFRRKTTAVKCRRPVLYFLAVPEPREKTPIVVLALVLACAAFVSFAGIGSHSLWTPDEPRDAAVGLDMLRTGDWVVPRLNGQPFLEKPPLYWWAQTLAYRALGPTDAAARVPSAVFGAGTLLIAFALGARLAGTRGGIFAALVLATTIESSEVMHRSIVDPALIFFVALGHWGFVLAHAPRSRGERRAGLALFALAIPLSFLAKAVVGPALVIGPPVLYLAATRRLDAILGLWPAAVVAAPLSAALVGPWLLALYHEGGAAAVRECLVANTVGRFQSTDGRMFGHHQPFWYYLGVGPGHLAPWVLAIPAMVRAGVWGKDREGEARRALFAVFLFGLVLLSIPSGKRGTYLVPLFPAFAATCGWWCATIGRGSPAASEWRRRRLDRTTLTLVLAALAILPAAVGAAALVARFVPAAALTLATIRAAFTPAGAAALGVGALVWTAFFALVLRRHARARTQPAPALVGAGLLLVFLAYETGVKAAIDPLKDLHPLTAAIARAVPATEEVLLYAPNETMLGIVNFDLGRRAHAVWSAADLRTALEAAPGRCVVYDKHEGRKLPADLVARLEVVFDDGAATVTPHVIAAWRGAVRNGLMRSP